MAWLQQHTSVILCVLMCSGAFTAQPFMEYGVVTATNGTFKFVGEVLELYCNITDKELREDSSMLHFRRRVKNDMGSSLSEYTENLTTKAIRLQLKHADIGDDGMYECYQETFSGKERLIGSQIIRVDYKPKSVKNITCRVYNWEEMKCTWDLGVEFQYPDYVNVSLAWTTDGFQFDCPNLTRTSCVWNTDNYKHAALYLMLIEVKTIYEGIELANEKSPRFMIETQLYVEPAPVNGLKATVQNSSCVQLSWKNSESFRPKHFVAEYRAANGTKWNPILLNQEDKKNYNHDEVCSLAPFTNYEFRISVLPSPVWTKDSKPQGHRSEWRIVSAKTYEDVPAASPRICRGCFHELMCSRSASNRCIQIYWQDLEESAKNGIIKNYNITCLNTDTGRMESFIETKSQLSAKLTLASRNSFEIILTPGTSKGFSRSSSSLFLPSIQEKPNPPSNFLLEIDEEKCDSNATFFLSWAALDVDAKTGLKYTGVSVIWCRRSRNELECMDDIQWTDLSANYVTYELRPRSIGLHCSDFLIGITAEVSHKNQVLSSGIYWSTCVYFRNQRPQMPPKNLRQSPKHPSNGLTILWDKFECSEEKSFIIEYLVKYCTILPDRNICTEVEKVKNISNTVREVTLENLKEGMKYKVTVMAVSSAGSGPSDFLQSDEVKASFPETEASRTVKIAVGLAVSLVLIIIAVIAVALWRYCHGRKKKIPNTDGLIQPYAWTSVDMKNRPLPEAPKEQHYCGSSACMRSDEAKNNQNCEASSEESVNSQTTLISSDIPVSPGPASDKLNKKKSVQKKVQRQKRSSSRETEALLDEQPSVNIESSPDGFNINNMLDPSTDSTAVDYSTFGLGDAEYSTCGHANPSKLKDVSWKSSPSDIAHSTSGNLVDYHQFALDGSSHPDKLTTSIINFGNANTLPLRSCNEQTSVYPTAEIDLQTTNSFPPYVMEEHKMFEDLSSGQPESKYISDKSEYIQRNQSSSPSFDNASSSALSLVPENLDFSDSASEDGSLPYVPHLQIVLGPKGNLSQNNKQDGYSLLTRNSHSLDASVPSESHLQFLPLSPLFPPLLYPENSSFASNPSSSIYNSSSQNVSESQPFLDDKCIPVLKPTSVSISHYTPLEAFSRTAPLNNQSVLSNSLSPTALEERFAQPSDVSADGSPIIYVDNVSGQEGIVKSESFEYSPAGSAASFQRHSSRDSTFLHSPCSLTRPLSGDLLELPQKYYEEPKFGGSDQILTEL